MGEIKLIKKEPIGSTIKWTFQCFCSPKPLKEIVVTLLNENEAKAQAQSECDEYCSKQTPKV